MLDDHTITTVCKVIVRLSADNVGLTLTQIQKFVLRFNFCRGGGSSTLTFIERTIADRQSSNTTDNEQ